MQKFVASQFGWSLVKAEAFVGNATESEVIDSLVACIPAGVHPAQYERALPAILHRRTLLEVGDWVLRNDLRAVFCLLTRLELRTVRCVNPYYLHLAHDVALAKCADFAAQFSVHVDADAACYAVAASVLKQRGACPVDELHAELAARGVPVPPGRTVDQLAAFPPGHIDGHALVCEDVDLVPAAVLTDKVRRRGGGNPVDAIRERKFMQNRVVLRNFRYTFRSRSHMFVAELDKIKQRAEVNEPRIKRVYKKLKT